MKICVPVDINKGLDSKPFGHFGSAPLFIVYDLESGEVKNIENGDLNHEHGKCQPLKALSGTDVDIVIVGGIGQGAISKLSQMGIKVYKSQGETIKENISLLKENKLDQFSVNHKCNNDDCSHH